MHFDERLKAYGLANGLAAPAKVRTCAGSPLQRNPLRSRRSALTEMLLLPSCSSVVGLSGRSALPTRGARRPHRRDFPRQPLRSPLRPTTQGALHVCSLSKFGTCAKALRSLQRANREECNLGGPSDSLYGSRHAIL